MVNITKKGKHRRQACLVELWRGWIRPILPVVIVLATLRSSVADWNDVPTGSMQPTILIGDRISVNKLAYGLRLPFTDAWIAQWGGPGHGEIAIMKSPDGGTRLVKRVIGLPGDVIEMRDNRILINGQPAAYASANADTAAGLDAANRRQHRFAIETLDGRAHAIMIAPDVPAPRSFGPLHVPQGHYLVMGDNRDRSRDSRVVGFVPRANLIGRVSRVVISLDYDDYYLPRWNRFFHKLP